MRIGVYAVGRMKSGPERELADRYFGRFAKSGPAVGMEFAGVFEIPESRAKMAAERRREEAQKLAAQIRDAAILILDERGRHATSEEFAQHIGKLRDSGQRELAILVGGPDGHDEALRRRAAFTMALGAQTWPHQLVRVMLAEQLYRAATIMSGHPYHRG